MSKHWSHIHKMFKESPFDEDILYSLDLSLSALTIHHHGLRFASREWNKRGCSQSEINKAEDCIGAEFPDDFRLFLSNLHDPKGVFFCYSKFKKRDYEKKIERVLSGIIFDVEKNNFWLERWGEKPKQEKQREEAVREDFKTWPKIAPVRGHRYLLLEPNKIGNPVMSIWQTDIIYYGPDLLRYLCNEFFHIGLNTWIEAWESAGTGPRPEHGNWNELIEMNA